MIARRTAERLAGERGFSMAVAVFVMFVSSLLMYAAVDAVTGDVLPVRTSLDQNRALQAAYAGLSAYRQQLQLNSQYWDTCPTVTNATVPGSTDDNATEYYSYFELPATTAPSSDDKCDTSDPTGTLIEGNNVASGSFRVEVTGSSGKISRTIVAEFRPPSFLDYVYFTDYEMPDPALDGSTCSSWLTANGYTATTPPYYWTIKNGSIVGPSRNTACGSIEFVSQDSLLGPMHSNDELEICGSPTFGRSGEEPPDAEETPGTYAASGCTDSAQFKTPSGQPNTSAGTLAVPQDDSSLVQIADGGNSSLTNGCSATAGCVFTGPTRIVLNGSSITVTNASYMSGNQTQLTAGYPTNGVIYVQDGSGSCPAYSNGSPAYPTSGACGNATVSGPYTESLTIASANDVIINGSLTTGMDSSYEPTGNDFLGLIANDFVRIAHPCGEQGVPSYITDQSNPTVDAAILAVNHSFIVDNYNCGSALGTLTVDGAIAQSFRGAVGTADVNGGTSSGYLKQYEYDGALADESPPYFLNPTGANWDLVRETECDTRC
ncbi:MAG: hypothetical protein ABSC56_05395 [Solirubrobacteraceae bacterium]